MSSLLATVKSFVANLLLWSFFTAGLAAAMGSGVALGGTRKDMATIAGSAVALVTGLRLAKKPQIKGFLSKPGTLWFLVPVQRRCGRGDVLRHGRCEGNRRRCRHGAGLDRRGRRDRRQPPRCGPRLRHRDLLASDVSHVSLRSGS
ncbi:hypothetical protein GCM10010313_70140 [Streptomyces violarus]|uniref:Uncharacterized protein n=1 Tax=Streptomyces violarus TaxID=67380 RepID=A0A7W4ZYB7_9ACTN|nr:MULTISPECIES: hypothetical protein [Streptomyces]MBB3081014.1 hypothetical protein [Streptomyces violarus]WRU02871.1 hypothetical protein VJ737_36585 [Streptomyces sp. CGMCC 4.1772]GHD28907.1 hypothetical protein GCM10010313_70140 [Streptomyces violarus]